MSGWGYAPIAKMGSEVDFENVGLQKGSPINNEVNA